jgi:salicylate hydroxylase
VWELQDLESLPTWTRGRAILIGDAAHAMTPMQGQGANMAIEDADSLRLLTADLQRGDVPKMLKQIESFRKPRTVEVLARTRQSQSEVKAGSTLIANLQFVYGYNGIHEAMKAH